jgi:Ca-activated chloride channel family protein
MRFLAPDTGIWVLAGLAVIALLKWRVRWHFVAATRVDLTRRLRVRASIVRRLPFVILAAAVGLLALAMMEPVIPYSQTDLQSRGLDIVILLDLSSSMQEEMGSATAPPKPGTPPSLHPRTRLDAIKDAVRTFIRSRHDDRIGLVVFSDNPYVVSPLTFDHDYLLHYIDFIDDKILQGEGQTAIGDGIALSDYVLSRQATEHSHGHQVIVLFTDGENNRGREPVDVLKEAKAADIRVHVVGVDIEKEVREKPAVQAFINAIRDDGGQYFNADSERQLNAASQAIDHIEKGLLVSRVYVRDVPIYQWFALPALFCFLGAIALRSIPYFVDQT